MAYKVKMKKMGEENKHPFCFKKKYALNHFSGELYWLI